MEVDEAKAFIFLSGDLLREGVEVEEVAGVECCDVHLKLLLDCASEGCITCKV